MSALHRGVIDLKLEKYGFRDGMIFLETRPRSRYLTTLTKLYPTLTTYLPKVDICEGISLVAEGKICLPLTFPVPPTYLPRLVNVVKERPQAKYPRCVLCSTSHEPM